MCTLGSETRFPHHICHCRRDTPVSSTLGRSVSKGFVVPPHTDSLCEHGPTEFPKHFHLCSPTVSPSHTCFHHQWIFITPPPSLYIQMRFKSPLNGILHCAHDSLPKSYFSPLPSDMLRSQSASVPPPRRHKGRI